MRAPCPWARHPARPGAETCHEAAAAPPVVRSGPDPATPVRRVVFVSVDCEMTGLDPARNDLLSVGAVALRGMRMDLSATFRGRLRPICPVRPEGVPVHRILPGEAASGDEAATELARFDAWLAGLTLPAGRGGGDTPPVVLLGWCLGLDEGFLAAGRKRAGLPPRVHPRCDVQDLFRHVRASGGAAVPDLDAMIPPGHRLRRAPTPRCRTSPQGCGPVCRGPRSGGGSARRARRAGRRLPVRPGVPAPGGAAGNAAWAAGRRGAILPAPRARRAPGRATRAGPSGFEARSGAPPCPCRQHQACFPGNEAPE